MKMMPPDVISHENQLQHLPELLIFMLDVFRTADHAGQIFTPHRPTTFHRADVAKIRLAVWVCSLSFVSFFNDSLP